MFRVGRNCDTRESSWRGSARLITVGIDKETNLTIRGDRCNWAGLPFFQGSMPTSPSERFGQFPKIPSPQLVPVFLGAQQNWGICSRSESNPDTEDDVGLG